MNGDSLEIMNAIGDMRSDLQEDLGNLKAQIAGMNGSLTTGLLATNDRVKRLEDENTREGWRNWLERGVLAGLFLGVHKILNAFGIKI